MKKLLIISAALFIAIWAVMSFIFKAGEIAYVMLAIAGIIILFRYSLRHVIT